MSQPTAQKEKLPTFYFDDYKLRPAVVGDLSRAVEWSDTDPFHRDTWRPTQWIEQTMTVNSYMLEDSEGPVFFFRCSTYGTIMRIAIQFGPLSQVNVRRALRGLTHGMEWLQNQLRSVEYQFIEFDSCSPELIAFCKRRLGFSVEGDGGENVKLRKSLGETDAWQSSLSRRQSRA